MLLPKSGRVIIIDDKPQHVIPLISALSKHRISSTYFDAKKETLPLERLADARVVFLDINLSAGNQSWEAEKAALIGNVTSIINPRTPYILFIWSVNEDAHFADVVKLFENELIDYKPIIPPIAMGKHKLFKLTDPETDEWELQLGYEETLKFIEKRVNEGIAKLDSIEALIKWENLVSDSSSIVVNDIINLAKSDGDINLNLKQIYFNLAYAYWGKTLEKEEQTPPQIVAKSLINLNSILSDKVEFKLSNDFKIELLKDFPPKRIMQAQTIAAINTKLLFSEDVIGIPLPGNLYLSINDPYKKAIIGDLIDRSSFAQDYCAESRIDKKDFYEGNEIKKEHIKPFQKYGFRKVEQINSEGIYMDLELTPICDYSQDNRIFCRMISGVILDANYRKNQKKSASYFYVSPMFLFEGKLVNFYCDFRYVSSILPENLNSIMPKLRIRHLFQADIQSQLARQVSRPGLVSI